MKVLLAFPPHWCPVHPYLATPMLKAFLERHGHQVAQRDLAAEAFHWHLAQDRLSVRLSHVKEAFWLLDRMESLSDADRAKYRKTAVIALDPNADYIAQVQNSLAILRNADSFYDSDQMESAWKVIYHCFELLSAAYYPTDISPFDFNMASYSASAQDTVAATADRITNPYLEFFEQSFLPDISRTQPDVLGISMTTRHQLIPALTIARLVRKALPGMHITVGGNLATRVSDVFERNPELFDTVDSVILYEGEQPLLSLLEYLQGRRSLWEIPNLLFRSNGRIVRTPVSAPLSLDDQPPPDFDGLPFQLYLSPEFVVPILSGRGCDWRRCAFCAEYLGTSTHSSARSAMRVVQDMASLSQKYRTSYFMFSNVFVTAEMLAQISDLLLAGDHRFRWFAKTKLSSKLTSEILNKAFAAGCVLLNYGLESASEKVLAAMDKGCDPDTALRVLGDTNRAGIWSHVYFLFNFPGETEDDARRTVKFIFDHDSLMHSININFLRIEKGSRLHSRLHEYFPELVSDTGCTGCDFTVHTDLPREMYTDREWHVFSDIVATLRARYPLWYRVNVKDHFFLYICRHGKAGLLQLERAVRKSAALHSSTSWRRRQLTQSAHLSLREGVFSAQMRHDMTGVEWDRYQATDRFWAVLFRHTYGADVEQTYSAFPINDALDEIVRTLAKGCSLDQLSAIVCRHDKGVGRRDEAQLVELVDDFMARGLVEVSQGKGRPTVSAGPP